MTKSIALSPHFTLAELTFSQTAARLGLDNTPSLEQVANLKRLCTTLLEPLRAATGACPLMISSGFRSRLLNIAVRGSKTSDHLDGRAADLTAPGYMQDSVLALADAFLLRALDPLPSAAPIDFDQLIYEGTWLHISIPRAGEIGRKQVLTARFAAGKKTTYLKGLIA